VDLLLAAPSSSCDLKGLPFTTTGFDMTLPEPIRLNLSVIFVSVMVPAGPLGVNGLLRTPSVYLFGELVILG
tara:strand:+ start:383 stop:598 length:216 start_codon:yes stop_codon:yes gene_type:complete